MLFRSPLFGKPAARASRPAPQAPAPAHPAAAPARARPLPSRAEVALHRRPLTNLHLARIAKLEQIVGPGRYLGWCVAGDGRFAVDVLEADVHLDEVPRDGSGAGIERYFGETLHLALGAAIRAAEGRR